MGFFFVTLFLKSFEFLFIRTYYFVFFRSYKIHSIFLPYIRLIDKHVLKNLSIVSSCRKHNKKKLHAYRSSWLIKRRIFTCLKKTITQVWLRIFRETIAWRHISQTWLNHRETIMAQTSMFYFRVNRQAMGKILTIGDTCSCSVSVKLYLDSDTKDPTEHVLQWWKSQQ